MSDPRPVDYRLRSKLERGEWIVSVEVDPPQGLELEKSVAVIERLRDAGVDCIDSGDSPMASVRMSPVLFAAVTQPRTGVETIIHFTSRDRNLMALQADLIGAHVAGVRSVIALSGDPPSLGKYGNATGVWDVKADGLIALIATLNTGTDSAGNTLGGETDFTICAACNPNTDDLETEIGRMREKADRGAHVFLTQPSWEVDTTLRFLETVAREVERPVILGVMPLVSERNARFVATNVPGVRVPDAVVERMTEAGEGASEVGLEIARQYLEQVREASAGVYFIPVLNRFKGVTQLVREFSSGG